jgi:hypothetical protein
MAKFRHDLHSQFDKIMRKNVFVLNAIELFGQLKNGKRVEGVLYMDQSTGKLTFKAYNRQPRVREKDRLVKKLPWGWVRESMERIKVFGSFPKDFCTAQVIELLNEHNQDAKNALIDRELDIIEFC